MKNPIKHIVHMWKDPINTIDEANARKKEVMPWLIGSAIAAVLFCALDGFLSTGILMIFGIIGILGVMAFGFMLFIIAKAKAKFEALTCSDCGTLATIKTPEEFAKYVSYTIGTNRAEFDGINHPSSNNGVVQEVTATGSARVSVDISLTCPNCGRVKSLAYHIKPFSCYAKESKVPVLNLETAKMRLENAVKAVIAEYNDEEKRAYIPYSIHSKKNPDYENRTKLQVGNGWIPKYNGVFIGYHKDVEEMVEAFFLENQLDGNLIDLSKGKK